VLIIGGYATATVRFTEAKNRYSHKNPLNIKIPIDKIISQSM